MKEAVNPYLPSYEYIPDGEPHVFDGRVYIYGSHDRANGKAYCEQHYQVWSAPVNNPHDWRYNPGPLIIRADSKSVTTSVSGQE